LHAQHTTTAPAVHTEVAAAHAPPPPWWPMLLSSIDRADRAVFAQYPEAYEFDRRPVPGELWPGAAPDGCVVRVRLVRGNPVRRLVVAATKGVAP
jgi:hypothetical protein